MSSVEFTVGELQGWPTCCNGKTGEHKDFAQGNAADAHRTSRVRRVTLRTAVKVSSNFIHGVTHNHHERGSVAAAHVDTAAAVQMDWMV